jgi:hypothetical protein
MLVVNLVTPKAAAKQELLFKKPTSAHYLHKNKVLEHWLLWRANNSKIIVFVGELIKAKQSPL